MLMSLVRHRLYLLPSLATNLEIEIHTIHHRLKIVNYNPDIVNHKP